MSVYFFYVQNSPFAYFIFFKAFYLFQEASVNLSSNLCVKPLIHYYIFVIISFFFKNLSRTFYSKCFYVKVLNNFFVLLSVILMQGLFGVIFASNLNF